MLGEAVGKLCGLLLKGRGSGAAWPSPGAPSLQLPSCQTPSVPQQLTCFTQPKLSLLLSPFPAAPPRPTASERLGQGPALWI